MKKGQDEEEEDKDVQREREKEEKVRECQVKEFMFTVYFISLLHPGQVTAFSVLEEEKNNEERTGEGGRQR